MTLRNDLSDRGVDLRVRLHMNFQQSTGGIDTENAQVSTGRFNVDLFLNTAKLGLWTGGKVKAEFETQAGEDINRYSGGSPAFRDSLIGGHRTRLRDAYYEHRLELDPWYLRGLVDGAICTSRS